jgi:hypothetical protein
MATWIARLALAFIGGTGADQALNPTPLLDASTATTILTVLALLQSLLPAAIKVVEDARRPKAQEPPIA